MKFAVDSIKLEIIVKINSDTVLCHETNKSTVEIPSTNTNNDPKSLHSSIDRTTNSERKEKSEKSFFSKLMCCCSKKQPSISKSNKNNREHVTATDTKINYSNAPETVVSVNLDNTENASNYLSVEEFDFVHSDKQSVVNILSDTLSQPMKHHSELPTSSPNNEENTEDATNHLNVTPTDYINQPANEIAENRSDDQSTETKLLRDADNKLSNHMNFTSSKDHIPNEEAASNSDDSIIEINIVARAQFSIDC